LNSSKDNEDPVAAALNKITAKMEANKAKRNRLK